MKTLAPNLRRQLERTIADARDVAETGARVALEGLAVHDREPYAHMSADQRALRQRLRARARQLGDSRDPRSRSHEIGHLVHECAYEHWHGMLFARFLAENRLLIEPDLGVAVTLSPSPWRNARNWARRRAPTSGQWRRASPMACCPRCSGPITRLSRSAWRGNTG